MVDLGAQEEPGAPENNGLGNATANLTQQLPGAAGNLPFVQPPLVIPPIIPPVIPILPPAFPQAAESNLQGQNRTSRGNVTENNTQPRATFLPKIELPTFRGERGSQAEVWLTHLTRFQRLYNLSDFQLVEMARISCKGEYASLWASMLPDEVTLAEFLESFRSEFVTQNQKTLMRELLDKSQTGTVGEYATEMLRLFRALDTPRKDQVKMFCQGLKFGIRESVTSSDPESLLVAIRRAKKMEESYETEPGKGPLGSVVRDLDDRVSKRLREGFEEMRYLFAGSGSSQNGPRPAPRGPAPPGALQTAQGNRQPPRQDNQPNNLRNPNPRGNTFAGFAPPNDVRARCPRCLQTGHRIRECPNPSAAPYFECCKWFGRHNNTCANFAPTAAALPAPPPGKPPGSINFIESVHGSDFGQPNWTEGELYPLDVSIEPDVLCEEHLSDSEKAYSSSEDEAGECYVGPKVVKGRKNLETLPTGRTAIAQPLSAEERARRYKTRVDNRTTQERRNKEIIKLTLQTAGPQLAAHKHLRHFRTDTHRYVDDLFSYESRSRRAPEVHIDEAGVAPRKQARISENSPRAHVNHLKVDIDPKQDQTNYQTEVSLKIENALKQPVTFRAVVDSGATSSGINESVLETLGLQDKVRATDYTYRTAGGEIQKARGVVRLTLRLGPITVTSYVVVMPSSCKFNLLLGNEIMTVLQGDILRSEGKVRFQYASTVVSIPLLPREKMESMAEVCYLGNRNMPDGWVNRIPPSISLPKNGRRAAQTGRTTARMLSVARY